MSEQSAILLKMCQQAARISNDILFGNIEAFGNPFERAQRHTKELSRINVDNAKTSQTQQEKLQQSYQLIDKEKFTHRTVS